MLGDITDEQARTLLANRPADAVRLLYSLHHQSLLRLADCFTRDRSVSEDIVQETFTHIWQNRKKLCRTHQHPIEWYLVKVVKYKSITHYKKSRRRNHRLREFIRGCWHNIFELTVENQFIREEVQYELRRLIASFPQREKECLLMRLDNGMTVTQIAAELNVSKKAVERTITSANKRLRKNWTSGL